MKLSAEMLNGRIIYKLCICNIGEKTFVNSIATLPVVYSVAQRSLLLPAIVYVIL